MYRIFPRRSGKRETGGTVPGGQQLLLANAFAALKHSNRVQGLETGTVILEGTSAEVAANPKVKEAYLGE